MHGEQLGLTKARRSPVVDSQYVKPYSSQEEGLSAIHAAGACMGSAVDHNSQAWRFRPLGGPRHAQQPMALAVQVVE